MNAKPFVSVICLCYNHEAYVEASIRSVMNQTYDMVELIVVDDGSKDNSREVIARLVAEYGFTTMFSGENLGNCRAFNKALVKAHGNYIIDLAADDVLMPERIERGVWVFGEVGAEFGVHFCDVALAGPDGEYLGTHYERDHSGKLLEDVPAGDVYKDVLERYFISTPSMMMRRSVFDTLGGYDESLTYEDFDFWVRAARKFKFAFTDDILVKKHVLPGFTSI
jgi:glycosyltransferase involved in cell wall biosynthesis